MATEVMTAPEGRIIHKTYAVLSGSAIPQRVHVTQYDESLPVIACTLYKDGQLYTIPDGASVRLRMNKNGLPVYHEAMGIDDARHVVYIEITAQMTVLYGEFAMVIEVETSDGKTAGTSYLRLIVRQNPIQNPELDNIPDYTANSNRLMAEGVKKLQDESSTQQKAIEDKGKNTLESIPADYSTLSGKVDKNTSGISELKEEIEEITDKIDLSSTEGTNEILYIDGHTEEEERYFLTKPILLNEDETFVLESFMYSEQEIALCRCTEDGTLVEVLGVGAQSIAKYVYNATNPCYIRFGYKIATGVKAYKYEKNVNVRNLNDYLVDRKKIYTNYTEEIFYKNNGGYTEAFERALLSSPIQLKAGEEITVVSRLYSDIQCNLFVCDENGNLIRVIGTGTGKVDTYKYYTDKDCYVRFGGYKNNNLQAHIVKKQDIFHVGSGCDFSNLTNCLKALQGNEAEKIIYIHSGIYDMFAELGGSEYALSIASGSNWNDVNVIVPPNTKIIGIGDVVLNFMPKADEIGTIACNLLSPINLKGSVYLENLTINADNCRYCIHDESGGADEYATAKHIFKNIICNKYKSGGIGYNQAYACGFGNQQTFDFFNCTFKSSIEAFSFHDNINVASGYINIDKCIIIGESYKALRLGNAGYGSHVRVNVSNSYMNKNIFINSETGKEVTNGFDVTVLQCGNINVDIHELITTNNYPHSIYN